MVTNGKNRHSGQTIIKLAALAVGGQGGGVLTNWITDVAERNGYLAQSTSVAGVAQRTGATIYYVEMCPDTGRRPVFALSPAQGDVDILIAAELMEAGRAVMRGFVTPDRTTLIASSHRIAAVSEKIEPGDGRADAETVHESARRAASRYVAFDMEKIAVEAGSVISASLFGALAGSGALPFPRESYEETIRASGRGVKASLAAFGMAYERAAAGAEAEGAAVAAGAAAPKGIAVRGPERLVARWNALTARAGAYPEPVRAMVLAGLRKVVDYQDPVYGAEYLDRVDQALKLDGEEHGHALSTAAAKHLANAMCYDDILRVADLKTRTARDLRIRREMNVGGENVLQVTEFFHPRVEELCGTLPARLGLFIEGRPALAGWIDRRINRGRRIRTDSLLGFGSLWLIGTLRPWRRSLLRHQVERAHLERWYALALATAPKDYALAVEILNCRRLIKGYSDTHVRAHSKFDRVLSGLKPLEGRPDAADWLRRLREAALKDEKGTMLDGALKTIATLDAD
ncbi:indolepyruvate oxidoreductase subunit beta family protein [Nitratireductor sp. ZSWI3]|uniref:indolepyruvate oxidoreductase subunit beta family protein n=1 Tax=Nitratireductor sp. ZSWI3 TaxID=2966359 RepID=UPI00214F6E7B|nr:indolepyruvate oxidoreductase subunit beta family protein [Nitratireductor sp. ZSWI3]MCR4265652.1 indolepyruvate oxidoreductase subunit beta family protein [Nitratireductor sp. ZSWI3]